MSEINNPNWYEPISINKFPLKRIGIKLNKEILQILKERIEKSENDRGVNILLEGFLEFDFTFLKGIKGQEYKFNFTNTGNFKVLDWDCKKAYNGSHAFWIEGFQDKEIIENENV